MYNNQIFNFIIIIHDIYNILNRDYKNRQLRDNFVLNYIIRSELNFIINISKIFRFNILKYIIIISRIFQLQKIYHDTIEKYLQLRS